MSYMFYCEDLETLNGTDVNGTIIGSRSTPGAPFLLTHGDKIFVQPNWNFVFKQNVGSTMVELKDVQKEDSLVRIFTTSAMYSLTFASISKIDTTCQTDALEVASLAKSFSPKRLIPRSSSRVK